MAVEASFKINNPDDVEGLEMEKERLEKANTIQQELTQTQKMLEYERAIHYDLDKQMNDLRHQMEQLQKNYEVRIAELLNQLKSREEGC